MDVAVGRRRSSSSASWGPARRAACGRWPRSSTASRSTPTHELERELGESIESYFDREGEAAFRAIEEEAVLGLLARAMAASSRSAAARCDSERVREALQRHLVVLARGRPGRRLAARLGQGAPARARRAAASASSTSSAGRSTRSIADAVLPPADRGATAAGAARPARAARRPTGTRLLWATRGVGRLPGVRRARAGRERLLLPRRAPLRRERRDGRALHSTPRGDGARSSPGRRAAKTLVTAEWVLRRDGVGRAWRTSDIVVGARRRRRRRPRRLLRGGLPARHRATCRCRRRSSRRSTRPTAARPASTCPRARTTSAPTTSRRRCSSTPTCSRTLPPAELAAGYAEVLKTALIAGGSLWARVREATDPDERRDLRLRCARSSRSWPRTSATRACARCSTSATPSAHAIEAATGYARYRHGEAVGARAAGRAAAVGRDALRKEVAGLLGARGLPTPLDGASTPTRCSARPRATRSAARRPCLRSCW